MVFRLTGHVMGLSSFLVNIAKDVFGINRDAQESNQAADELKKKMTYCQVNLGKNSPSYQFHGCLFWCSHLAAGERLQRASWWRASFIGAWLPELPKTPSLRKWHLGL